ncbi:hypothetical protein HHJ68_00880 [Mobiluncus curtisii]|uniref:cell wall-binding repeat-containing protein n=2 Tax=Mobiluncus curtisii TaxID=2051 RepID=UPI00146FCD26|nr:cell wall-binding repeat-containing protein [Mobiluncus curtisii]NMW47613.1 hypothetical protein [Mobiluncus curtisii]NMW82537.1 hypothetical protein [Mobiluncus curtisii]
MPRVTHTPRAVISSFAGIAVAASLLAATVPAHADEDLTDPPQTGAPAAREFASPDPQDPSAHALPRNIPGNAGVPGSDSPVPPGSQISPDSPVSAGAPNLVPTLAGATPAGRPDLSRVAGVSRFETAVTIARYTFITPPKTVYLAEGWKLADAMAAGSLRDGPVLLTASHNLHAAVKAYLQEIKPEKVIALGGTGSIPEKVLEQAKVSETTELERIAGADRFETANEIAKYAFPDGANIVYVTDGTGSQGVIGPDALTGASLRNGPILFGSRQNGLSADTLDVISHLGAKEIVQLGSNQLGSYKPTRYLAGPHRYATAVEVSKQVMKDHPEVHIAYLTNGLVLADSVAAGGRLDDGSVLLTEPDWLPYAVCEHIRTSGIKKVIALGGDSTVTPEVLNAANEYAQNPAKPCLQTRPVARGWVAPGYYLQAVDKITTPPGTVVPQSGWNGTKVREVRARLGVGVPLNASMTFDRATRNAVVRFQRRSGLPASGVVDYATWVRLTGRPWNMDNFQMQPPPLKANREQRIDAMLSFARGQIGTPYTWGGAGPTGDGYDCSGLALQALYAAGIDPQPINVISHAAPTYRTSKQLYAHPGLQKLPFAYRIPGDLVFWQGRGGIYHVAIYVGSNQVIESSYGYTRQRPLYKWGNIAPYIVRPLAT